MFTFPITFFGQADEEPTVLEKTVSMDYGYMGEPFVTGQVNLTEGDDGVLAMDYGYMGEPFVVWSNVE